MVVGITRTKNEPDVIEATVGRMLTQVDHVIAADGSDDGTWELLERMPVTLIRDDTPTYEQPQQMTALAHRAREMGAEWIVPFDADEVWFGLGGRLADVLMGLPNEVLIAETYLFNHVVTALDDAADGDPVSRIQWRRPEPVALRKVAVRARRDLQIHFGQHAASFDEVDRPRRVADVLEVRHFPYRAAAQLIAKISVGGPPLAASGLPESTGAHWRAFHESLERDGEQALIDWFNTWAYSADPHNDPELVHDPCPLTLP